MYDEVIIQNNRYGYRNKKGAFIDCGKAIIVKKRLMNIDNRKIKLLVHIYYDSNNYFEEIIDRNEFYSYNNDYLISIGADIVQHNKKVFQESIRIQEDQLETELVHSNIGYSRNNFCFFSDGLIGVDRVSKYDGNFNIQPKGSFEKWLEMVKTYVLPSTELQLSVIFGLSGVLVSYLRQIVNESLIVHFFGQSSSGKSTALFLAMSCACSPSRDNSLITNWNSTFNSIYTLLGNNRGYPFGIDELSSNNEKRDFSDVVYNFANGSEKDRLTASCNLKVHKSWSTTIISTGEISLLSKCNRNDGLNVRVLEYNFDKITPTAESANKIIKCVKENYGFALIELVKFIFGKNNESVSNDYYDLVDEIINKIKVPKEFSHRISQKIAILLLTCRYAKEALKINFNIDEIFNIINSQLEIQFNRTEKNVFERFMAILIEDITSQSGCYYRVRETNVQSIPYKEIAVIKYLKNAKVINGKKAFIEIVFFREKFKSFIKEKGFTDENIILKALKLNGVLDTDKDNHYAKYRTIGGIRQRVYVMYLTEDIYNPSGNDTAFSEFLV